MRRRIKLFRFKAKWIKEKEGDQDIKEAWQSCKLMENNWQRVQRKLSTCKQALLSWSSKSRRDLDKEIKEKSLILKQLLKEAGP